MKAHFALKLSVGCACRSGAAALALMIGIASLAGDLDAQQAPGKNGEPAPTAAPPAGPQSSWVKLCDKATAAVKDKNGEEEKKDRNICLTHHERLDGNTGMVLVSAAVRQSEGQDKQAFMVMVPLGMMIQPGMRASIYPKDMWEQAQKNEKIDETKLKTLQLTYTLCHPAGCTAEMEAPPELINDLKTSGGLVILAINPGGQTVGFPIPLFGFDQAYAGRPVDNKQYGEARKALMQQIAQHQQELAEQQRKQMEEQQKGAAGAATPKK
jgi:invasion protein IalB